MKILFIQLARLGDILLTIPAIRAYKRANPDHQVDLLVRSKFAPMAKIFSDELNQIIELDSQSLLTPLFQEDPDIESCLELQDGVLGALTGEYQKIVNFSYSPLSSYLSCALSRFGEDAEVIGYTRFEDGFLRIPDDVSAYFYAQVGPGMPNRYHMADIFASSLNLDLEESDLRVSTANLEPGPQIEGRYLVLHVGASQSSKSYPVEKWRIVIARVLSQWEGKVVLIGSSQERERAEAIARDFQQSGLVDLVGKTNITDLFPLIEDAELVTGADSVPMHIATMVDTPALNLSFAAVNFWETGPRSNSSRILFAPTPAELMSDKVSFEILSMLRGETQTRAFALYRPGQPCYGVPLDSFQKFEWEFVQALYTGTEFPVLDDIQTYQGFVQFAQANEIILKQLIEIQDGRDRTTALAIIERAEDVMRSLKMTLRSLRPLVAWVETQKTRIGPQSLEDVLAGYNEVHSGIKTVLTQYLDKSVFEESVDDTKSVFK